MNAIPEQFSSPATPLLDIAQLHAGYGRVGVLEDVRLQVMPGRIVALVGRNGAGKSTLLKAVSGLVVPTRGTLRFDGQDIRGRKPHRIVEAGLLHVAEGRRIFRGQSVFANLELGRYGVRMSKEEFARRIDRVHALFPILHEKAQQLSGALSGGQQQMLAIAQAVMREPRLLMLDEPSLGLSPLLVDQVLDAIVALQKSGVAILLVEQMVERALEIADRGYVLQNGRLIAEGPAAEIAKSDALRMAYLAGDQAAKPQRGLEAAPLP